MHLPVNIATFLRTPVLKNICKRPLQYIFQFTSFKPAKSQGFPLRLTVVT